MATTFTLTGRLLWPDSDGHLDRLIQITPNTRVRDQAGNRLHYGQRSYRLGRTGALSVQLVAQGVDPAVPRLQYTITALGAEDWLEPITFDAPAAGTTVDLADVVPATPTLITPVDVAYLEARDDATRHLLALLTAHDGPLHESATAPTDKTALWILPDLEVRQWVDAPSGTVNLGRQTATHSTAGWATMNATNLEMRYGRVTALTTTVSAASLRLYGANYLNYATPVTPGTAYTVTATIVGGNNEHLSTYAPRIVWHASDGTILSSATGTYERLLAAGRRVSLTATAPATAAYAALHIAGKGVPETAALLSVTRIVWTTGAMPTDWVDPESTPGYKWAGEAGLSQVVGIGPGWQTVTSPQALVRQAPPVSEAAAEAVAAHFAANPVPTGDPGLDHQLRREALRQSRGGEIGTGDTLVVALRLDHGMVEAERTGLLDLCDELDLPVHMSLCESPAIPAEDPIDWARVVARSRQGMEISNHSLTHNNQPNVADLERQIVTGLAQLQARVPEQHVHTWIGPGLVADQYDGWMMGATLADRVDNEAARLILGHHGAAWHGMASTFWMPSDGQQSFGGSGWFIDSKTLIQVQNHIKAAQGVGGMRGVIALHPERADNGNPAFSSPAVIESILRWLAAERDAGRLTVLTMGGLALAIATHTRRALLVQWTGALTAGTAQKVLAHQGYAHVNRAESYGVPWEAVATLTLDTGGSVTLTATCGAATTTRTATLPAGTHTLRRHVLLPLPAAASPEVTLTSTVAARDVTVRLQAV